MKDQDGGYDVLYPRPGVAAGYADQELKGVRRHCHAGRRDQRQQREQDGPRPVGVHPTLRQAQRLQVVGEGYGDDWKVSGEREHWEESQEDMKCVLQPGIGLGRLNIISTKFRSRVYEVPYLPLPGKFIKSVGEEYQVYEECKGITWLWGRI